MTARQAADGALHMEKYYLCERSIKERVRGDQGPPYFTSVALLCSKLETEPDPLKNECAEKKTPSTISISIFIDCFNYKCNFRGILI